MADVLRFLCRTGVVVGFIGIAFLMDGASHPKPLPIAQNYDALIGLAIFGGAVLMALAAAVLAIISEFRR